MDARATLLFRSCAVDSLNWQLRFFPCFPTAGNVPKVFEALPLQNTCGGAGAVTATAINRGRFVAIEFFRPVLKLRDKNVMGAWNMPFFPFTRRTHIENLQRPLLFVQLVHAH